MTPTAVPLPPPLPPRPPAPPRPPEASASPTHGPDRDDRRVPAAGWVAAVGATLVLAAAAVLVVGSWNRIRPEIKLVGLVLVSATVAALAEGLRRALPVVARALAHLAATLAVPSGVAVVAAAGGTWPGAVLVGGLAGTVACGAQSRRWRAPLLVPAAEVAAVLGLAGVAAWSGAPLGVLVAVVAALLLVARRDGGAVRLAVAAPLVPVWAVLGVAGAGPGTARRVGAAGEVLTWAGLTAGLIAAIVLGVVAQRRRSVPGAVAALLAGLAGVVTGLAELRPDGVVLLGLAGVTLLAVAALDERTTGVWAPVVAALADAARWLAVLTAGLGLGIAVAIGTGGPSDAAWGLAVAAWAAAATAFVSGGVGAEVRRAAPPVSLLRVAAVLGAAGAVAAFVGRSLAGLLALAAAVTAVAVATLVASSAAPRQRTMPAGATVEPRGRAWSAPQPAVERLVLAAACAPLAWAADPRGSAAWLVLAAVAVTAAALVATVDRSPEDGPDRRMHDADDVDHAPVRAAAAEPAATVTVVAVALLAALAAAPVWPWAPWAATVAAGLVAVVLAAGRRWLLAAAVAPLWAALVAEAAGATPAAVATTAIVGAVALTGVAMTRTQPGPIDAAAVAGGIVGLVVASGAPGTDALASLAGVVLGAQGWLYGELRRQRDLSFFGRLVLLVSLVSLPVTTGLADAVLDALAPWGVDRVDLAVALLVPALLAGGAVVRRRAAGIGSWPAHAPGLLVGGLHLLTTQAATGQVGRVAAAIGLGVVAVAVGGVRRLGAPLVLGTGLIAASAVLAGGAQLAELPVWVWLAVGGAALLGVAVGIERGGAAAGVDGDPERDAGRPADWLRAVWQRFE